MLLKHRQRDFVQRIVLSNGLFVDTVNLKKYYPFLELGVTDNLLMISKFILFLKINLCIINFKYSYEI